MAINEKRGSDRLDQNPFFHLYKKPDISLWQELSLLCNYFIKDCSCFVPKEVTTLFSSVARTLFIRLFIPGAPPDYSSGLPRAIYILPLQGKNNCIQQLLRYSGYSFMGRIKDAEELLYFNQIMPKRIDYYFNYVF